MSKALGPGLSVKVEGLSACYWDPVSGEPVYALREVALRLGSGDVLGVTGVSGGGKSTLAKALLGLIDSHPGIVGGSVRIDETPREQAPGNGSSRSASQDRRELSRYLRSGSFRKWRRDFDREAGDLRRGGSFLMLQEPRDTLNPYVTVGKLMQDTVRLQPLVAGSGEQAVKDALDQVELPSYVVDRYPAHLSTGMCQRVHLAMAITAGVRFLVADEPLIRLDLRTRSRVAALLQRTQEENGFTMLVLSHDLDLLRQLSGRIVVLKDGVVVEEDETRQFFAEPQHPYSKDLVRTFRELSEDVSIEEGRTSSPEPELEVVHVEQARKEFPEVVAVDQVSLSLYEGETLGLLGESGCGKTTLARMVIGLESPDRGVIELQITEPERLRPDRLPPKAWRELRSQVQLVYQDADTALDPWMKAGEAVEEAYCIHYPGLARPDRKRLVLSLFDELRLPEEKAFTYSVHLSGGESRRTIIAQSMAALGYGLEQQEGARLLVADEPTTGLDAETCMALIQFFAHCRETMGLTFLLVSHDLPILRRLCTRMAVMFRGKLVETGNSQVIATEPVGARHPFTAQILAASLAVGREIVTDGELATTSQGGCAFYAHCHHPDRCPEQCSQEPPLAGGGGHQVACWFEQPGGEG